jgi:hypothetical protein
MDAIVQQKTAGLSGPRSMRTAATTPFRTLARRWTPVGDPCDCMNQYLLVIRKTHI